MSCMRPRAPLFETQRGSKSDSTWITARTRTGSTPNATAWRSMIASYGERRLRCFASHRRSPPRPEETPKFEIIFLPSAPTITCTCAIALVAPSVATMTKTSDERIAEDGSTGQNRAMSFAPIQKDVDRYISQFKEGYFPPLSMLARVAYKDRWTREE